MRVDKGSLAGEDCSVVNRRVQREHEDALLFYVGELGAVYVRDLHTLVLGDRYPGAPWELFEARRPPAPLSLSRSAVHRLCQRLERDGRLALRAHVQPVGRPRLVASLGDEALLRCRRLRTRRHLLADVSTPEGRAAALARASLRAQLLSSAGSPAAGIGRDGVALFHLRRALTAAPFELTEAAVDEALPSPAVAFLDGGRGLIREHYRCPTCGYDGAFRQVHKRPDAALCEGALQPSLPLPLDVAYGLEARTSIAFLVTDDGHASLPKLLEPLAFLRDTRKAVDVWVAVGAAAEAVPSREPGRSRMDALVSVARELANVNVRRAEVVRPA